MTRCDLGCEHLATVSRLFDEKGKIVQAYCRKYNCDLSCHGGIVRRKFKCKGGKEDVKKIHKDG